MQLADLSKDTKSESIESIQMFRGIAAFMVLLGHSMVNGYFPSDHLLSKICLNGWMGVNIFFVISGFIIPYSMYKNNYVLGDFKIFFIKRIVRIEPPYIVSIAMVLFLNYTNTITKWYKGPAYSIDWGNVMGHLGYLNAFTRKPWLNWAYWTLAIEFQYYIIIAILFPLLMSSNKKIMMASFFGLLACFFIHIPGVYRMPFEPFLLGIPNGDSQDSGSQILLFLPFFLLGIAYFMYRVEKVTTKEFMIMAGVATVLCFYRHGLVLSGICIVSLIGIDYIKRVPKPLLWLGTISYSLYLTHYVLVSRFLALYLRFTKQSVIIGWLVSIVGCLVAAYLFYLLVEKPFIKLGKKVNYKHKPATA